MLSSRAGPAPACAIVSPPSLPGSDRRRLSPNPLVGWRSVGGADRQVLVWLGQVPHLDPRPSTKHPGSKTTTQVELPLASPTTR